MPQTHLRLLFNITALKSLSAVTLHIATYIPSSHIAHASPTDCFSTLILLILITSQSLGVQQNLFYYLGINFEGSMY